ncbi:hypothetical protein GN958_ATG12674 [Phytophthora infestans]|nr:hypothetical protein GN958_ATG12674 [Phytophthora infestans]KAI9980870.1 hypothetical protein PInf_010207 [Phytophthora infestans]
MNQRAIQIFSGAFFYFMANEVFAAVEIQLASLPLDITLILLPFMVFVPAYFLIGIDHGLSVYFYLQLLIILTRSASVDPAYAIGCYFCRADVATIMGMLILLPMLLFGGLMVASDDTSVHFVWSN